MPISGWNGRLVGLGNGAWAGSITYAALVDPLAKGYATAATDDGHQGSALDAGFAAVIRKSSSISAIAGHMR